MRLFAVEFGELEFGSVQFMCCKQTATMARNITVQSHIHWVTVTLFRSMSTPAGFRRHLLQGGQKSGTTDS